MHRSKHLLITAVVFAGICAYGEKLSSDSERLSISLENEARAAIERGVTYLIANQKDDGHWSNPTFPALTALPLQAIHRADIGHEDAIKKACQFISSCAQEDGGIYQIPEEKRKGGGLSNYNTAVCIVALHECCGAKSLRLVLAGRTFLAETSQNLTGSIYDGGMGYDPATGRDYTDLSNSYLAFEAMRLTADAEDFRPEGEAKADIDWNAARGFIQRCHNHPDFNDQPWVSRDPEEIGGFAYHPQQTRAGTVEGKDGVVRFRSMPGMTYAGLLSYIYADVPRNDPRIKATVQWAANHWNLDVASRDPEKAGTDRQKEGLFYMYDVMAKGLDAFGHSMLHPDNQDAFNWRRKIIEQILSMQKINEDGHGYWLNEVGRYWESDPVLVTAYAIQALQFALDAE